MMNKSQLATAATVAFAAFATWYAVGKRPGQAVPSRTSQAQREMSLASFWGLTTSQVNELNQSLPASQGQISSLTGKPLYEFSYVPGFTFDTGA